MHFHVYIKLPFAALSTSITSFSFSTCQFYSTIKTRTNAIFLNLPLNPLGKMLAQPLAYHWSFIKIFLPSLLCFALYPFICFQEGLPLPLLLIYLGIYYMPGMLCPALLPAKSPCPSFKTQLQHCFPSLPLSPSSPDIVRHYFMYSQHSTSHIDLHYSLLYAQDIVSCLIQNRA